MDEWRRKQNWLRLLSNEHTFASGPINARGSRQEISRSHLFLTHHD